MPAKSFRPPTREAALALKEAGVMLVSATENIDETPSGMLLHGIRSTIAEFYSRNLAGEVSKSMNQKAQGGGTNGQAPMGYLNVTKRDESGREVRTVEIDPDRAPTGQVGLRGVRHRELLHHQPA